MNQECTVFLCSYVQIISKLSCACIWLRLKWTEKKKNVYVSIFKPYYNHKQNPTSLCDNNHIRKVLALETRSTLYIHRLHKKWSKKRDYEQV